MLPPPKVYWKKTTIHFSKCQKATTKYKYHVKKYLNSISNFLVQSLAQVTIVWTQTQKNFDKKHNPTVLPTLFNKAPLKKPYNIYNIFLYIYIFQLNSKLLECVFFLKGSYHSTCFHYNIQKIPRCLMITYCHFHHSQNALIYSYLFSISV